MLTFFAKRIGWSVFTVLLATVLVFSAIQSLPGDAASQLLGQNATPAAVATMRQQLGLDEPPVSRFLSWLGNALQGNFGTSLVSGGSVGAEVGSALVNTSVLAGITIVIGILLSLVLGLVAGLTRDRWPDISISTLALVGMSVPEFVVATVLVLLFSIYIPIFPAVVIAGQNASLAEILPSVWLPAAALICVLAAYIIRMMRTSVIDVMDSEFVRAAILKGNSTPRIVFRHILPSAMLPTLNVIAMNVAWLVGGVVVVESIFNYPGIGTLMIRSVQTRDLPAILLITVMSALTYVVCNLLADLAAFLLNPRLRYPRSAR
ncbi:peptide/nickel transport system permease protein [Arthrobacter sp. V4I6]|uniref:ABC transporter permease n=1 Tax=unclassified Arthrobacter TaxID=235627 RepID=UPI00278406C1|nr:MULTISPECIES: ABC transporter permease [unclassified Arthrobacter]MDQ0822401.1 peptide/nickel transport system permease protein [Arthrobacter sp. V1I7]MDQ0852027.1 peptide/nickel transport system permease protein [Arthrobacter sp. V4I6]